MYCISFWSAFLSRFIWFRMILSVWVCALKSQKTLLAIFLLFFDELDLTAHPTSDLGAVVDAVDICIQQLWL